jgi:hypothetical protein
MAKRFMSTDIWDEDWFLDMPNEYKLFWFYVLSSCDHAGIFKVNLRSFCGLNDIKLTSEKALIYFNTGKERIMELNKNTWFIMDFFSFQYGSTFNENNRLHASIKNIYEKQNIEMTSVRGLKDLKERTKSVVKEDNDGLKDKDKDILYNIVKKQKNEKKFSGNFKAQGEELYADRLRRNRESNDD